MNDYDIIPLAHEHLDQITNLEKSCFSLPWTRNMFEEELESSIANYFVAMKGDMLIGYAGMWQVIDEGHITNIAVKNEYRRQGIASMLLERLIMAADNYPLTMLTLEVRRSNAEAQNLYKKYGFFEVGIRTGYYSDNNEDAIIMTRRDFKNEGYMLQRD